MVSNAKWFGRILVLLGIVGYAATGMESLTALIPSIFGLFMILAGYIGGNERYRKHAMHGAAFIALLGLAGTVRAFGGLMTLLSGGVVERTPAVISQSVMAVVCIIFLYLSIKSFVAARKEGKTA